MSQSSHASGNQATRLYAALVTVAGAALVIARAPQLRFDNPLLFGALTFASIVLSTWKVPLIRGGATLSMSYFTDFVALLLLGPDEGMLVAAASGGAQCPAVEGPAVISRHFQRTRA
jgi:hypothetical protein